MVIRASDLGAVLERPLIQGLPPHFTNRASRGLRRDEDVPKTSQAVRARKPGSAAPGPAPAASGDLTPGASEPQSFRILTFQRPSLNFNLTTSLCGRANRN